MTTPTPTPTPGYPGYTPDPNWAHSAPPEPKRTSWGKRIAIAAGVIVGIFIVLAVIGSMLPTPTPTPAAAPATTSAPAEPAPAAPPATVTVTVAPPVVPVEPVAEDPPGDPSVVEAGTYEVGVDIQPGTYRSAGKVGDNPYSCSYVVWADDSRAVMKDIGSATSPKQQMIVKVSKGNLLTTSGCAPFVRTS